MRRRPEQRAFAGFETASLPTDGLFFAVFPDAGAAERIAALARHLRCMHPLQGKMLAPGRLHVSLHHLGDYAGGLPQSVVTAAREAAAAVVMSPFDVLFDRAVSFLGRSGNRPYVLQGGDGVVGLRALHQQLGVAMQRVGLWRWVKPDCQPHITLLYGDHSIADHPVEPVGWTVREVVLVHSLHGRSRYEYLARSVLGG
jgi:2'-5' RNA ligase